MDNEPDLIDSAAALERLCNEFRGANWLALDTEFERVNTYYPELCLLQLCDGTRTVLIDPLNISNLEPLFELLYTSTITKVIHAARQDLELFYHLKGQIPVPLFDTQIAAALLGYDNQIGYANLIREELGVELDKSETRTNWKRRPLSPDQLHYAADDVIYLARVYERFLARLKMSGQLTLLDEQFMALTQAELYEPDPDCMWQKIKLAKKLQGEPLEYLKKLAAWREVTARLENQPRKWLLDDHTLLELARTRPDNQTELAKVKGLNHNMVKRHGQRLLEILQ